MMTAVGHLANHGYVIQLKRASGEEAILLAPDLFKNLASSIVLEARRHERGRLGTSSTEMVSEPQRG